ncbi:Maf family protein [Caldicoprobacter algeriensis]|uniref:Maf family protein n=1 Tax=Caldicoprobacter algeriensis TaxID=699281 RepID=UPI00207930B8|nr:Maf family protein [Caldicoprobacter algeriensis]MCM8900347.1 Maf family protein [Caldicoprobacter algeriensis]
MRIILASASPRRSDLLTQMGLKFEVIPSDQEEKVVDDLPTHRLVVELALKKVESVAKRVQGCALIIGADTIVVKGDKVLGKPKDEDEAFRMLMELQGQVHEVITGLAVMEVPARKCVTAYEKTVVEMASLTRQEVEGYIRTGEPMDKAGAYGIQGLGGILIKRIEGCYYNVVGLPIHRLWMILKEFGVEVFTGQAV